ncbi:unnamed protein product [Angiostrongylus costaricensis]|uniref:Endo/exonuclease/phosphatase domain-containing protein n=1 Tax=Angiostrongylus costaricensis TaxID=334426 RepID=A0A0R3Q1S5_ANGCS|nr:unnamed protein product [Angiostrongylus costaricensis]
MVTTCTYNSRALASESSVDDVLMRARRIRYDVISLAETRIRQHFNTVYGTREELFLGTCDSREVGGVGALVNTSFSMNIDSLEQLTTRIRRLRLKRRETNPVLGIFVVNAPTSNYDEEEVDAFYMDLEKFYREDHTFFNVIIGDFNAMIRPTRTSEGRRIGTQVLEWNEQGDQLAKFIIAPKTIHGNSQFHERHPQRWT